MRETIRDDGDDMDGIKHDGGKTPWALAPWDAHGEVLRVMAFGAGKYAPRNWERGMAYSRLFSALMRHLTAWWQGELADPETGLHPLAHAACDTLFLLAYELRGVGQDDRPCADVGAPATLPSSGTEHTPTALDSRPAQDI